MKIHLKIDTEVEDTILVRMEKLKHFNQILLRSAFVILPLLITLVTTGCSEPKLIAHTRDREFFDAYQNPSIDYPQAETRFEQLKMLETDESTPMRFVLFDNGKFYYQIDKLGDGTGLWQYVDGAVHLIAKRPIFDMNLYVSGAGEAGDDVEVRFINRYGFSTVRGRLRDPQAMEEQGITPPKLREFAASHKDI